MITQLINSLIELKRPTKRLLLLGMDFVLIPTVLWLSFSIRLGNFYLPAPNQAWIFVAAPVIALPIFIRLGLYRAILRYIGFKALWTVLEATSLYALIWSLVVLLSNTEGIPRTVYILNGLFALLFIGGSRMIARWVFNYNSEGNRNSPAASKKNVVIYGAGAAG